MALASDGPTGRRAARIAVFGLLKSLFDPISGGPGAITAAHGPGLVAGARRFLVGELRGDVIGSRRTVRGLTSTGWDARPKRIGPRLTATGQDPRPTDRGPVALGHATRGTARPV